ncbi:MAG: transposase [SAR324 cluster bacterium]|nr:transposase [SAR324 cluster bacterium]
MGPGSHTSEKAGASRKKVLRPCGKTLRSTPKFSGKRSAWLIQQPSETLEHDQLTFVKKLFEVSPEIQKAATFAREFKQLMMERKHHELENWLVRVESSQIEDLISFVKGVRKDQDAVTAAFELQWSNGPVEGQINRLKMIKRNTYDRAKLDLLEARLLLAG